MSPAEQNPQRQNEQSYLNNYLAKIDHINAALTAEPSIQKIAATNTSSITSRLSSTCPTTGHLLVWPNWIRSKVVKIASNCREEDKTLLMILRLSGLDLDDEVRKGGGTEREQRQYDLDDASQP